MVRAFTDDRSSSSLVASPRIGMPGSRDRKWPGRPNCDGNFWARKREKKNKKLAKFLWVHGTRAHKSFHFLGTPQPQSTNDASINFNAMALCECFTLHCHCGREARVDEHNWSHAVWGSFRSYASLDVVLNDFDFSGSWQAD